MSDTVLVKLLLGLVRAEGNRLKVYNAGDVVSVTSREAEHMLTRRRAELVEPAQAPTSVVEPAQVATASTEPAPVKPAPVARKKRGS